MMRTTISACASALVALALAAIPSHACAADFLSRSVKFDPSGVVDDEGERGELDGTRYRFWHQDGSGSFSAAAPGSSGSDENWDIGCKTDPMSDKRWCVMQRKDLWIWVYGNGKAEVQVGSEHFPGTSAALRLDRAAPVGTGAKGDGTFSVSSSAAIVQGLKKARSVTTRYVKWPHRGAVDDTWDLHGFGPAYRYVTWAVKQRP